MEQSVVYEYAAPPLSPPPPKENVFYCFITVGRGNVSANRVVALKPGHSGDSQQIQQIWCSYRKTSNRDGRRENKEADG